MRLVWMDWKVMLGKSFLVTNIICIKNIDSRAFVYATADSPPEIVQCITKHRSIIMRLVELLHTPETNVQISTIGTLRNLPKLFMLSPARNEVHNVKKQMYHICINVLAGGNDTQIQYLIDNGVIQQLCGGLDMNSTVLTELFQGLESIMKYGERSDTLEEITKIIGDCGGVEKIKTLQQHKNEDVYQKAIHILETYWNVK